MRKLILVAVVLFLSKSLIAYSVTDTTFTYDLNDDDTRETIKVIANENEGTLTLKVNNLKFTYLPSSTDYFEVNVVKINNKNYLFVHNADYYGFESTLFGYDSKIDSIGTTWSLDKPSVDIKGIIKVNNWLGFWSADYEYHLNNNKLEEKYKDEYTMPESFKEHTFTTTASIFLHSSKMINAKGLYEIKGKTQIYIIKADIKNKCKNEEEGWLESCNWYYIKSKDGTEGWIMLKDFNDKVEGIPWAG